MKLSTKLTTAGAVCALAVLASAAPALAATTDSGTRQVTASVPDTITVHVSNGTSAFGAIDPTSDTPSTTDGGTVTVASNTGYELSVLDDGGLNDGAETPAFLTNPLQIAVANNGESAGAPTNQGPTSLEDTTGTPEPDAEPLTIAANDASGTDTYGITLSQQTTLADKPSADYTDTLTYTAAPGI